jgi:hypothetical protein
VVLNLICSRTLNVIYLQLCTLKVVSV